MNIIYTDEPTVKNRRKVVKLIRQGGGRPEVTKTRLQSTINITSREDTLRRKKRTTAVLKGTETESCPNDTTNRYLEKHKSDKRETNLHITESSLNLRKTGDKEVHKKDGKREEGFEGNTHITIQTVTRCLETPGQVKRNKKK